MRNKKTIFSLLKSRRYSREDPFLPDLLQKRINSFQQKNEPISLVGFWGVGEKVTTNWTDKATCDFLNSLRNEVKQIYPPGLRFLFILTRPHGKNNAIPEKSMASYFASVKQLLKKYQFETAELEPLWEKYDISLAKVETLLQQKPKDWWQTVYNRSIFEKNAEKRSLKKNSIQAAQQYVMMRQLEKTLLEKEFAKDIFHTFSNSSLREVLPNLPTCYFYGRPGWSNAPWFIQ